MSPVHRLLVALIGPAALLAASACSEPSGPTKEQYLSMAGDVCEDGGKAIDEIYMDQAVDELLAPLTGEEDVYAGRSERWVRAKVVPEYESLSGRLKGIPPPDGDHAYLGDLYGDLDARIEMLRRRPSDGRAVIESDTQVRDRFESYGIEGCPPVFDESPDWEDPAKVQEEAAKRMEEAAAPASGEAAPDE